VEHGRFDPGPAGALTREQHLHQHEAGDVVAARDIQDGDGLPAADQVEQVTERDVAARLDIVELAVGVPPDRSRHV
jgi:hypothetical protein